MSIFALSIITFAAAIHAVWNAVSKRAKDVVIFGWLSCLYASIIFSPLAYHFYSTTHHLIDGAAYSALLITVLSTSVGFLAILLGYKLGDYSVMYPISRGTGPLVATLAAILFLNETPSLAALAGIAMIAVGVFIIGGGSARKSKKLAEQNGSTKSGSSTINALKPIAFGILTGCLIANTTVWAKICISTHSIHFLLVDYAAIFGMFLLLTPYVLVKKEALKEEWQSNKYPALLVGICRSLAYLLVLFVLSTTPVYYVAPLREMSILFATLIGAKIMKEGQLRRRLAAAVVLFVGLVSLSIN